MQIDRDEVRRIAALAQLEIAAGSEERMAADLTEILTFVERLSVLDEPGDDAASAAGAAVLREDVVRPSLPVDCVAANAPGWENGLFVVPRVIGGD